MVLPRYLQQSILADLKQQKMVFIGGPRQVGKTTLAKQVGLDTPIYTYLNWDNRDDRKKIISYTFQPDSNLIIFDEIHKYRLWKKHIKGLYDKEKEKYNIIVTGSARLDVYRRGGDSLMGRYHYYRLHPFSMREALGIPSSLEVFKPLQFLDQGIATDELFSTLIKFGGFPEPFIAKDETTLRRFHNERLERLVKEDIRDLETIRDLGSLQVLVEMLPEKVGSLFSLNALREDLQVAHKTVSLWVDILEKFYYHFRIYTFASNTIKSLRKEPKLYLWDWSQVENPSARLENMVASHLLKTIHWLYDSQGFKAELFFLRDREGREVDFLVTVDKKPWFSVEVKQNNKDVSSHLKYFGQKLKIPFQYQIVGGMDTEDYIRDGIRVLGAAKFLSGLV